MRETGETIFRAIYHNSNFIKEKSHFKLQNDLPPPHFFKCKMSPIPYPLTETNKNVCPLPKAKF